MKERVFRSELVRGARSFGYHVVAIPDSGHNVRFGVQKPYDVGILADGHYLALELKQVKNSLSFNTHAVEVHQYTGLQEAENSGASSYLVVNFRYPGKLTEGATRRTGVARNFKATYAIRLKDLLGSSGSIPIEALMAQAVELPYIKIGNQIAWDVRPLT